jgi:hypothetical protein
MTAQCTHDTTTEREGETWTDGNGQPRTVVYVKCANPFCAKFGQTVRVRTEGDDMPQSRFRMPPVHVKGIKP